MVTPEVLNRYIKPGLIRIAENLHGIRLLYIGGKEASMVPYLAECGYDGIGVYETVNVARIKTIVGEVKVLGNISSKKTLTQGTPERENEKYKF